MTQPFFSLIMPAYNCENTVSKTIESVKKQQWTDYEFLIINDGSTDQTLNILEQFSQEDNRIKVSHKENGGPGSARNEGLKNAQGKYVLFMDSDDELLPNTLKTYAMMLINKNPDLIVSSYQMNVMDGKEVVDKRIVQADDMWIDTHASFMNQLHDLMENQLMYVIWNKIYKLDIIKKESIFFPDYSSCEDRLFNIRYYEYVKTCQISSEILYDYSFDGRNSLTNKFLVNKFDTFEEFYVSLKKLTNQNIDISSALFLKGTMSCIIPLHSENCPYTFGEKYTDIKRILNNASVREASKMSATNTNMRIIMRMLFKSKSVVLNYIASNIMYHISHLSPRLIEKLKGNF